MPSHHEGLQGFSERLAHLSWGRGTAGLGPSSPPSGRRHDRGHKRIRIFSLSVHPASLLPLSPPLSPKGHPGPFLPHPPCLADTSRLLYPSGRVLELESETR